MNRGGFPRGWSPGYCNHMADSYGTMGFQLVVSRETDPVWNLAMEEIMFSELAAGSCRLFVYRNSDSVICGRFQNPWLEADTNWLAEQDVPLVRRASGGGTVWHDTGNWNFSFIPLDIVFRLCLGSKPNFANMLLIFASSKSA